MAAVKPIFDDLTKKKQAGLNWRDLADKENGVYQPLLNAFRDELNRQNQQHKDIPQKIVEHLLGKFDFYKIISVDKKETTEIQAYNLRGTLNRQGVRRKRIIAVPQSSLPSRIVSLDFKPDNKTTLELYLDNGWQFTFRIHNAASKIEPSLKFDIQLVGMPATIFSIACHWQR